MAKKRTRAQKIKTANRQAGVTTGTHGGYKVEFGSMNEQKVKITETQKDKNELAFFRSDLTKVMLLTMLALASEIVLWLILKH